MSKKRVNALLKGLRYISQIFEKERSETEMQIGYPTDVKHVAHIGWMNDFTNSAAPEISKSSKSPTTVVNKPKARRSSKSKLDPSDEKQTIKKPLADGNDSPMLSTPRSRNPRRERSPVRLRSRVQDVAETYKSPFSDPGSMSISNHDGLCHTPSNKKKY